MTRRPTLALLALASLALVSTACQLPPFLPEFQVNTSAPGNNYSDGVAMGEDGDFVVAWNEATTDPEVYGRLFNSDTTPAGAPFAMNANTTPDREPSAIARDAQGRFVIVWAEDGAGIRGQRFDSDGTPLGANFQVNTSTSLETTTPFVACDPSGNFVATWTSGAGDASNAAARRFNSNGAPLGDEFLVNVHTTGFQRPYGVANSPAGFVVTWFGDGDGAEGVFARRFDEAGTPMTGDIEVNFLPTAPIDIRPDVGMNAAGDFIVVWGDQIGEASPTSRATLRLGRNACRLHSDQRFDLRELRAEGRFRFRWKFHRHLAHRAPGGLEGANPPPSGRGCTTSAARP